MMAPSPRPLIGPGKLSPDCLSLSEQKPTELLNFFALRRRDVIPEGIDSHCDKGLLPFVKSELGKIISTWGNTTTSKYSPRASNDISAAEHIGDARDSISDSISSCDLDAIKLLFQNEDKVRSLVWNFRGSMNYHKGMENDLNFQFHLKDQLNTRRLFGTYI